MQGQPFSWLACLGLPGGLPTCPLAVFPGICSFPLLARNASRGANVCSRDVLRKLSLDGKAA